MYNFKNLLKKVEFFWFFTIFSDLASINAEIYMNFFYSSEEEIIMAIKYKWLADRLKEMIFSYIEKGIEKLPTEQELCERFRVSR